MHGLGPSILAQLVKEGNHLWCGVSATECYTSGGTIVLSPTYLPAQLSSLSSCSQHLACP
jgi:hypothetical protein